MFLRVGLILLFFAFHTAAEPGLMIRFHRSSAELPSSSPARAQETNAPPVSNLPFAAFHFPLDQSPTLGFPPGPFSAEISGFVSVDLRAQHSFTLELTGEATLFINGKELLRAGPTPFETNFTSAPIRLNKGTNVVLVRYTSPTNTPAIFRLHWSSRNSALPIPIPPAALSHSPATELKSSLSIQNGAYLFTQFQCGNCHTSAEKNVQFDSPTLAGVGSRLNTDWLMSWLINPSSERHARMPRLMHGADTEEHARAIAAYLSTLTTNTPAVTLSSESAAASALINNLHCRSCHTFLGEPSSPDRISLSHVPRKFVPGALVNYLEKPQAHFPFNPMPNFKLNRTEAESIAGYLLQERPTPKSSAPAETLVAKGRQLVQKSGCLNCHSLGLPNQFTAPSLAELSSPSSGCLDPNHPIAPQFDLSAAQRADLRAFLEPKNKSSSLPPADLALRSVEFLRCNQCHTENSLPSPLTLGGKIKPEWAAHFITDEIPVKPRPWLKARMPAFPAYATDLAAGLAALHGYPARTPAENAPDPALAKTGETLVSANGGFSCVACHAVGSSEVQLVVESPGVNLAYSGDRLLPAYFRRWLMNPIAIEPGTKMPAYFDAEGRSQLTEFFDGNAHTQINAIWDYIRSLSSTK